MSKQKNTELYEVRIFREKLEELTRIYKANKNNDFPLVFSCSWVECLLDVSFVLSKFKDLKLGMVFYYVFDSFLECLLAIRHSKESEEDEEDFKFGFITKDGWLVFDEESIKHRQDPFSVEAIEENLNILSQMGLLEFHKEKEENLSKYGGLFGFEFENGFCYVYRLNLKKILELYFSEDEVNLITIGSIHE